MRPKPLSYFASLLNIPSSSEKMVLGVSIDSRLTQKGDLYFATSGKKVDGHDFLQEVASKGATGAVVKKGYKGPSFGLDLLFVDDVTSALQDMARLDLKKRKSKIVGITGSLGKTTTKEFTATLLQLKYRIAKSPLSYNSQLTLPLSILLTEGDEEIFVLEMGMSEPHEMAKLVAIAPPDIALITTIACQHATSFPEGMEGIAREKCMIFSHPHTKRGFYHEDCNDFGYLAKSPHVLKKSFSLKNRQAAFFLEVLDETLSLYKEGEKFLTLPHFLPVKELYLNFLAAFAIASELDVSLQSIQESISKLKLPPMRFEKVERQGILFINDAYNANPDSMKAALKSLPPPCHSGKKIAVLSEMNALGHYTEEGHENVANEALKNVDILFCLGKHAELMQKVWEKAGKEVHYFLSKNELGEALKRKVTKGDVVLLKGARAHALEELLKEFDE